MEMLVGQPRLRSGDHRKTPLSLTLPTAAKGPARPLFQSRPSRMAVESGKLSGRVSALEVHCYEFREERLCTAVTRF